MPFLSPGQRHHCVDGRQHTLPLSTSGDMRTVNSDEDATVLAAVPNSLTTAPWLEAHVLSWMATKLWPRVTVNSHSYWSATRHTLYLSLRQSAFRCARVVVKSDKRSKPVSLYIQCPTRLRCSERLHWTAAVRSVLFLHVVTTKLSAGYAWRRKKCVLMAQQFSSGIARSKSRDWLPPTELSWVQYTGERLQTRGSVSK